MASIPENEIPAIVLALQQLMAANNTPIADELDEDEIKLVREHRRQKQLTILTNRGIEITKPKPKPEAPRETPPSEDPPSIRVAYNPAEFTADAFEADPR